MSMAEISLTMAKAFAQMSKAFVISASGVIDDRMRAMLSDRPEDQEFLRRPDIGGGSVIVGPDTRVLAGPLDGEAEDILYADLDFELGVKMKLRHDLAGHYNRPDVFRLAVNRRAAPLFETVNEDAAALGPQLPSNLGLDSGADGHLIAPEAG